MLQRPQGPAPNARVSIMSRRRSKRWKDREITKLPKSVGGFTPHAHIWVFQQQVLKRRECTEVGQLPEGRDCTLADSGILIAQGLDERGKGGGCFQPCQCLHGRSPCVDVRVTQALRDQLDDDLSRADQPQRVGSSELDRGGRVVQLTRQREAGLVKSDFTQIAEGPGACLTDARIGIVQVLHQDRG